MSDQSKTYCPETCEGTSSVISLPESEGGLTRCASSNGPTINQPGQALVPANLSARQAKEGGLLKRHLWPAFYWLIQQCRPSIVFGEQVASKAGRLWLAGVRSDLEALEYGVGGADLCAAGMGAPHVRQRLYWLANSHISSQHKWTSSRKQSLCDKLCSSIKGLGDSSPTGLQGEWSEYLPSGERCSGLVGLAMQVGVPEWNGPTVAIQCSDGPRRISAQPNAFPLAHGVQRRMGKLRGSGNAIVPQVAAAFIEAYLDCA